MTFVPPIPPVDAIGKLAGEAAPTDTIPTVNADLAKKFNHLMQARPSGEVTGNDALDAASKALQSQQQQLDTLQQNMADTVAHASQMEPADRFEAFAKLAMDTSLAHMKISLSTGVTKTSNKSLQTLLKNE